VRELTLARQKDVGVVPQDAVLTARPEEIPAWDDLPADLKSVLARQMEVYAGFLEHTDHHVGRLVDALAELELLDDTLIYVIIGDNGASAERTLNGTFNEMISLNGASALETPEFMTARIDKFGTSEAYNHYAVGWAHAMDADETTDVGADRATPVSDDYGPKDSAFTGRVRWVQIDLGDAADDHDHLITPEERYRVAITRQ
jgi:arylsulfatase A-like enzyme